MIIFKSPVYFVLLLILPIVYFISLSKKKYINFPALFFISKKGKKVKVRSYLSILFQIFLILIVFSLTDPVYEKTVEMNYDSGIDIMIALDVSGSMVSEDYRPNNRLEIAKKVVADFIDRRPEDRIGFLIFSGQIITRSPLTYSHYILKKFLKRVKIGILEDGTAIGMALSGCVNRLIKSKDRLKRIILLTDGVNNKGEISPLDAGYLAKEHDTKIYIVGVGKKGKALFPVRGFSGEKEYVKIEVEIDEPMMKKLAEITEGKYFRAHTSSELKSIFTEISELENESPYIVKKKVNIKLYPYFLILIVILIFIFKILDIVYLLEYP